MHSYCTLYFVASCISDQAIPVTEAYQAVVFIPNNASRCLNCLITFPLPFWTNSDAQYTALLFSTNHRDSPGQCSTFSIVCIVCLTYSRDRQLAGASSSQVALFAINTPKVGGEQRFLTVFVLFAVFFSWILSFSVHCCCSFAFLNHDRGQNRCIRGSSGRAAIRICQWQTIW